MALTDEIEGSGQERGQEESTRKTHMTKEHIIALRGRKAQSSGRPTKPAYAKPVTHSTISKYAESEED